MATQFYVTDRKGITRFIKIKTSTTKFRLKFKTAKVTFFSHTLTQFLLFASLVTVKRSSFECWANEQLRFDRNSIIEKVLLKKKEQNSTVWDENKRKISLTSHKLIAFFTCLLSWILSVDDLNVYFISQISKKNH